MFMISEPVILGLAQHPCERYARIAIVKLDSARTVVDRVVGREEGEDG